MIKPPRTEQECYDLGYDNPAKSMTEFSWPHLVFVNAYFCGQADRQNNVPRSLKYNDEDYDITTGERHLPSVQFER